MSNGRTYGRVNAYKCQSCKNLIVTKDVEDGVTPFMIECRKCEGDMYSAFYKVPQDLPHDAEWRSEFPPDYDAESKRISQDHRDNGGLFLHYLNPEPERQRAFKLKGMKVTI